MITPKIKDEVLNAIFRTTNDRVMNLSYSDICPNREVPNFELEMIIDQFQTLGLVSNYKPLHGIHSFNVSAKLHDFRSHGGFHAQEEILKGNLEKLGYELEILARDANPSIVKKATELLQLSTAIFQALQLFTFPD